MPISPVKIISGIESTIAINRISTQTTNVITRLNLLIATSFVLFYLQLAVVVSL